MTIAVDLGRKATKQTNINPSLVLVQHRKTRPYITERLLMGRKESNQTKTKTRAQTTQSVNGHIYSNKKETSDFHGTEAFNPVKMLQQN